MLVLKPDTQAAFPDWFPQNAVRVLNILNEAKKQSSLFVGGCVRNIVMGAGASDIDIATRHKPETVQNILR